MTCATRPDEPKLPNEQHPARRSNGENIKTNTEPPRAHRPAYSAHRSPIHVHVHCGRRAERDQDMRSHHHMQNRVNARSQHIEVRQRTSTADDKNGRTEERGRVGWECAQGALPVPRREQHQNRIIARSQHIEVQEQHRRRTMRTEGPRYEVVLAGIVLGVHYRSRKGNNTGSRHGNKES